MGELNMCMGMRVEELICLFRLVSLSDFAFNPCFGNASLERVRPRVIIQSFVNFLWGSKFADSQTGIPSDIHRYSTTRRYPMIYVDTLEYLHGQEPFDNILEGSLGPWDSREPLGDPKKAQCREFNRNPWLPQRSPGRESLEPLGQQRSSTLPPSSH